MGGPKSFGFGGRQSLPNLDGNATVAPLVSILGNEVDETGALIQSGVIGMIIPEADNRNPNLNGIRARWLTVAALGYGMRNGSEAATKIDRLRSGSDASDDQATNAAGVLMALNRNTLFDGSTWDRARSSSAAALSGFTSAGAGLMTLPGNWAINHTPATATQATISRAAGGAGVRHVCTSIDAAFIIPNGVNQALITLNLRDGATGAGTILWSRRFGVGVAVASDAQQEVSLTGLNIVGTANTAMTLEFSAAGAATTSQSVALCGFDCL